MRRSDVTVVANRVPCVCVCLYVAARAPPPVSVSQLSLPSRTYSHLAPPPVGFLSFFHRLLIYSLPITFRVKAVHSHSILGPFL